MGLKWKSWNLGAIIDSWLTPFVLNVFFIIYACRHMLQYFRDSVSPTPNCTGRQIIYKLTWTPHLAGDKHCGYTYVSSLTCNHVYYIVLNIDPFYFSFSFFIYTKNVPAGTAYCSGLFFSFCFIRYFVRMNTVVVICL